MKRKWEERLKKVEERASHYERNPLPPVYRPRLSKPSMPSSVWKIFHRQVEAFNYVKTCKEVNCLIGECVYFLRTFKVHLKYFIRLKDIFCFSFFFPPVLKQQGFVLGFCLFGLVCGFFGGCWLVGFVGFFLSL